MTQTMPQIKKIVFLMLENRSLDNVLGWLYHSATPKHVFPKDSDADFDGLKEGYFFNPIMGEDGKIQQRPVIPIPDEKWDNSSVPWYNPEEAMVDRDGHGHGVINQLFGTEKPFQDGEGITMPRTGTEAGMDGFLQDYQNMVWRMYKGFDDILWCHTPKQLPQINQLAYHFAVSDRWFSSVPTQTNPNRAFSICGTSLGREINEKSSAWEQFDVPTIFNKLGDVGKSWGIYSDDPLPWGWRGKNYTKHTFPQIAKAKNGDSGQISRFKDHAANGTLPDFSYLEPEWSLGHHAGVVFKIGTDYHPPAAPKRAEEFLGDIYRTVRNSPHWHETLFIVTFDEHGGTYDHVAPPWGAKNPDGLKGTRWGFNFELFGARVPTILISPFIAPQTVFRAPWGEFDHTSFIKTILDWAGADYSDMGERVKDAPPFDGVLQTKRVNKSPADLSPVPFEMEATPLEGATAQIAPDLDLDLAAELDGVPQEIHRVVLKQAGSVDGLRETVARFKRDPAAFNDEDAPSEG